MDWTHLPSLALRLAVLFAGLLMPGSLLLRALRLPWMLSGAFLASAALLHVQVLLGALTGLPFSFRSLAGGLALASLVLVAWNRRAQPPRPRPEATGSFHHLTRLGWWAPLALLFWGIVAWRLGTQPLNGPDTGFRWAWLAEQMLRSGSLDFYPARSAEDFARYFWAESLPPGVAGLYAWAYACGGGFAPLWTVPVVALQVLALHELIWRLACAWGGEGAARRATLLAMGTPLLTWAVLLGQETGLTALAACGLVLGVTRWRQTRAVGWLALAGVAAAVGAAAREYGPVFPLLGLAALAAGRAPRRAWLAFGGVAGPLALAWPLLVAARTGNPFYSLDLGGLLPVNRVFVGWTEHFRAIYGAPLHQPEGWWQIARLLALFAWPAVLGAGGLAWHAARGLREAREAAVVVAVVAGLWLVSVPFTAGGLFYSLRVLSPALALAGAFGGYALVALAPGRMGRGALAVGLAGGVLMSLPQTLTLPENSHRVPWRTWPAAGGGFTRGVAAAEAELRAKLAGWPEGERVLSESAGLPRALAPLGLVVVPPWSPEVAWLFDPALAPDEVARHWQATGFRHVVLTKGGQGIEFFNQRARWRAPWFRIATVAETERFLVLQVTASLAPPPPLPPSAAGPDGP